MNSKGIRNFSLSIKGTFHEMDKQEYYENWYSNLAWI